MAKKLMDLLKKYHISSEEDQSHDGASKDSVTKKRENKKSKYWRWWNKNWILDFSKKNWCKSWRKIVNRLIFQVQEMSKWKRLKS